MASWAAKRAAEIALEIQQNIDRRPTVYEVPIGTTELIPVRPRDEREFTASELRGW